MAFLQPLFFESQSFFSLYISNRSLEALHSFHNDCSNLLFQTFIDQYQTNFNNLLLLLGKYDVQIITFSEVGNQLRTHQLSIRHYQPPLVSLITPEIRPLLFLTIAKLFAPCSKHESLIRSEVRFYEAIWNDSITHFHLLSTRNY